MTLMAIPPGGIFRLILYLRKTALKNYEVSGGTCKHTAHAGSRNGCFTWNAQSASHAAHTGGHLRALNAFGR